MRRPIPLSVFGLFTLHAALLPLAADPIRVTGESKNDTFPIVADTPTPLLVDAEDAKVVQIAAGLLADDIERVTTRKPTVHTSTPSDTPRVILAGTIDTCRFLRTLEEAGKLDTSAIRGRWESFLITTVTKPFDGVDEALIIAGADRRGAAYGLLSISEAIGVSPWVYWADVPARSQKQLHIAGATLVQGPPSVKYRGIFINDEDFGLQPWAAQHLDTDIRDIGPRTYARVFELLLRLKANYCWPAMHPCTKAFNLYEENRRVADDYAIVMGASHCEPMLRNNVTEWRHDSMGAWDYETNRDRIYKYWEDRVRTNGRCENLYTVGMRGIHDSDMPGGGSLDAKSDRLSRVIRDQREILTNHVNPNAAATPQIFCPYKEVLDIYKNGVNLPEDITIVWPDDNHGYIRNLSTPEERGRSGGSGVYYHLSYWGRPSDYLWLSSTSPARIAYEMQKAYAFGARRVWVFNVGDIKPAEIEMEFAMRLAYDVDSYPAERAMSFLEDFATRNFGAEYGPQIAGVQAEYYRLTHGARPEHSDRVHFSKPEREQRAADYRRLVEKLDAIERRIPSSHRDAFFQLVAYPVKCAALMDQKARGLADANPAQAFEGHDGIQALTHKYNKEIAGGKWDGIMDASPRNLPVFHRPDPKQMAPDASPEAPRRDIVIAADAFTDVRNTPTSTWIRIPGLGIRGGAMTLTPYMSDAIDETAIKSAPSLSYPFEATGDRVEVEARFLPTHRIHDGVRLRYAVRVDAGAHDVCDLHASEWSKAWSENVLRGYSKGETRHALSKRSAHRVTIYLLDPGMVLSEIRIRASE
ncbi:MAG TPA: glycosyl hydrolase 115 family protein [Phycisphaerae bacterium]|nr:glycosyl hydrolase 115 family protein [Phycisphaerae bacterium]HRW56097.1 glycosyl hydrolase 115 family protein [Phycisphaerae bacterium]